MRKKFLWVVVVMMLLQVFCFSYAAANDGEYAWVLVETQYRNQSLPGGEWVNSPLGEHRPSHDFYQYYTKQDEKRTEFRVTAPRGRTSNDPPQFVHGVYSWSDPPDVVRPGDTVSITVNQEVFSIVTGGYIMRYSCRISMGHPWNMYITEPVHIADNEYTSVAFGETAPGFLSNESVSVVFSGEAWRAGREGSQQEIMVVTGNGGSSTLSERYIYEWKQVSAPTPAPAPAPSSDTDISIYINNRSLQTDAPPVMLEGRTLVPLRAIFEALGMEVEYTAATQTITGTKGESRIVLTVDSTRATVNGAAATLDVPAKVISGRTMVPVRFIAESTGQDVVWDGVARRVYITTR